MPAHAPAGTVASTSAATIDSEKPMPTTCTALSRCSRSTPIVSEQTMLASGMVVAAKARCSTGRRPGSTASSATKVSV